MPGLNGCRRLASGSRTRVGVTTVVVAPVAALANYRPVVSSFCQPFGVSPLDPVNQTAAQTTDRWNVLRQQEHSQRQHPEDNNRQKPQEAAAEKQQGDRYPHPSGRWLAQPSDPARKRRWQLADERLNTRIIKHLLKYDPEPPIGRLRSVVGTYCDFAVIGLRSSSDNRAFEWRLQRLLLRPGRTSAHQLIAHPSMNIYTTEDEHRELLQTSSGIG